VNYLKLPKMNISKIRQLYYTPESIVHPTKMDLALTDWILQNYVHNGDIVLDPMAGIFTTGIEGMRKYPKSIFIGVELEKKFVDLALLNVVKTLEHRKGDLFSPMFAKTFITQGDARELEEVMRETPAPLLKMDAIVTSPSYGGAEVVQEGELNPWQNKRNRVRKQEETFKSEGNLGMMKYGKVDAIVSSPPFAGNKGGLESAESFRYGEDEVGKRMMGGIKGGTGDNPENLDNAPYDTGEKTYLTEMMKVYAQCNAVLKTGGIMVLVTKNFVRNGEQVRLDLDTIRLCEVCGFELVARHYRKLIGESFWRVLYRRKWEKDHPGEPCPVPRHEDVLVFRKVVKDAMPF
jgi:DNA modification methylase